MQQSATKISATLIMKSLFVLAFLMLIFDTFILFHRGEVEQKHLIQGIHQPAFPNMKEYIKSKIVNNANYDKGPVLDVLREAGINEISSSLMDALPTWRAVVDHYGSHPIIRGLETCQKYRDKVPEVRRMLGAAGMFSSGTNLVTQLLKNNCQIPARVKQYGINATREEHGMRWQVPWGKHTDRRFRDKHSTEKAKGIQKDDVLPVVTIRNPWHWMQSMCKNPYTARWPHFHICPNLRLNGGWNNVTVKYGAGTATYKSLVHLFNDWYRAYLDDLNNPYLMVRMEDLVFHTKETITQVCGCAGGRIRSDRPFVYIVDSAKADSPGHDISTGFTQAWIKYSKPLQSRAGFVDEDYEAALEGIDQSLMDQFDYRYPPSG